MADWSVLRNAGRDYLTLYGSCDVASSLSQMTANISTFSSSSVEKTDENTFCHLDNVEDCISFLNQELTTLGFQTIEYGGSNHGNKEVSLVNRLYEIFRLYQRAGRIREELENRLHRHASETEHYQNSNHRLKKEKDQLEREVAKEQEKCRQLVLKQKALAAKFKTEKDEVKRLQNIIKDRDAQYKHELKKKEREINKLKEKLHHLIAEKTPNRRMGLDIANSLQRADGKRSQWKTGSHDKQEEMYQLVIHNYEDKQRELMIENTDLRDCLVHMQRELGTCLKNTDIPSSHKLANNNLDLSHSSGDEDDDGVFSISPRNTINDFSDGYFQMPYDLMRDDLQRSFKETCKRIKEKMGKNTIPPSQQGKSKQSPPRVTPSQQSSRGDGNMKELDKLQKQIRQYKDVIHQQEEFIQQSLQNQSKAAEHSFLNESALLQEKENLAEQRRLFYQEKANFEEERKQYTEAAIRLGRERKALDDERTSIINQFLQISPFVKSTPSNSSKKSFRKGEGTRLLPSTPLFSPAPSNKPKTPSTTELYRVLGITPKDVPKRKEDKSSPEEEPKVKKAFSSESLLSGSCKSAPCDTRHSSPGSNGVSPHKSSSEFNNTKRTLFRRRSSTGGNDELDGL